MSLLDSSREDCVVYLEENYTSPDGNLMTRASVSGIPARATFQVQVASGTSSRRSEQDNEGFESEANYRVRFPRDFPHTLGAQSKIQWRGVMWSVVGDARFYNGSANTAHVDYAIRRA